jgi:hypothetical protein
LRGTSFVLGILFVTGDRMQILTQRLSATKPFEVWETVTGNSMLDRLAT